MMLNKGHSSIFVVFLLLLLNSCNCSPGYDESGCPNDFEFLEIDIAQLQSGYYSGEYTVREVIMAFLERIEQIDRSGPMLNSIITINPDAITIADSLDRILAQGGKPDILHGLPVVLKDNIDTADKMPSTAGSRALRDSYPREDSFVAGQLRKAGAVIIGKANLSEWANFRGELSTSGWSGLGGLTKNPYILDRNPCGSSYCSEVAVSANLSVVAIGTETNGSIVCPSHATGIVGIKPTVGLVSRAGIIPISFSMDIAGPMARSVADAALVLGVLTGTDPADEKTLDSEDKSYKDYTRFLRDDSIEGKRIGFYTAPLGRNFKVDSLMRKAVDYLERNGARIIEIDDIISGTTSSYAYEVMLYEYKEGLNKYFSSLGDDSVIKDLDDLIEFNRKDSMSLMFFNQRYLEIANEKGDLSSPGYLEALKMMHRGSREEGIDRVMDLNDLDAIIAPTGSPAWKTDLVNGDSFQLGSSSPAAISGYPNITVPMGYIDGLPVGISFFGRAWSEPVLIGIAYAFEKGTRHRRVPGFDKTDPFQ